MADKRAHASPKCCDLSICQQHVKKKRRKCERTISKIKLGQNILDWSNIKQPQRNVVQYLYVDPVFIEQATCPIRGRIRAGGVGGEIAKEDNFYDCASESDWDENKALVADPMQLVQISDVINQIKDPKEFRALLKELAYTSYILYRSFRKAYGKTKKDNNEHKCEYCRQKETRNKAGYNPDNNDPIEFVPANFNGIGDDPKSKGLCPICFEPLAENPVSIKSLNPSNPDYSINKMKNPESPTAQPEGSKLMIDAPSKTYPGINEQASQTKQLDKPSKSSRSPINEQSSQTANPEGMLTNPSSASKSCVCAKEPPDDQSKMFFLKPLSINIPLKLQVESENMKPRFIETEIVLKSYPPSQQLGSPPGQLPANKSSQNPAKGTPSDVVSTSPNSEDTNTPRNSLEAASDIFHSCISSSGIIEPITEGVIPQGKASLNEVFDIINKRMQTPTNVSPQQLLPPLALPPPPPLLAIKPNLDLNLPEPSQLNDMAKVKLLRDQLMKEVKDTLERSGPEIVLKPIPNNLPSESSTKQQLPVKPVVMPAIMPAIMPAVMPDTIEARGPEPPLKPLPYSLPNESPIKQQQQQPQPVKPTVMPAKEPLGNSKPETPLKPIPYSLPNDSQTMQQQQQQQQQPIKPAIMPVEDPKDLKPLSTSPSFQMVMHKSIQKTNDPLKARASWSHFTESVPEPTGLVSEIIQTDVTAVHTTGHYKRNELRGEIKEDLQELLEPKPIKAQNKYEPDERDDILLDLSKLFHPETAPTLPKHQNKDNTLDDIRYLLEPPKTTLEPVASRASILINIRYILQPKLKKKPSKKLYSKQTREKILEDLHEVLTPKKLKKPNSNRIRDSVLKDLRTMLDDKQIQPKAKHTSQPAQPPRQTQRRTSRERGSLKPKVKQPNEIDNSVLADLIYLLDTSQVHPQAATSPPVAANHHVQMAHQQPTSKNETEKKPPTGSSPNPDPQNKHKVDQAKLNPSSQVVDQTPKGWMATTKAEGVSLTPTLSTETSSETFFARMHDTSPENFRPRSTLIEEDGKEVRKSLLQKLKGTIENELDILNRGGRNDLAELSPKPKMLSHATQSSNENLNRPTVDAIHDIVKSDLKSELEPKGNLYRLSSDKAEPKARKSTDVPIESKSRKPKDLSQIMEASELLNVTSQNNSTSNGGLSPIHNQIKPKSHEADVKEIDLAPRKSYDSKLNLQSGWRSASGRYDKLTEDFIVKPQEVYNDRTRYSEHLLEAEKRPSITRYAKPIDDPHVKPQEKHHDRTRYSEQLVQDESPLSKSKYGKHTDDSYVKPQEKARYSEQLVQDESRLSKSKYGKPTDDSYVKPQEKSHDKTRYSDQLLQDESPLSKSRYNKPTDNSYVKPQAKSHDRSIYSEQLLNGESQLPRSRYGKPTDDSHVKPQEKPHDKTRYSELMIEAESRPSQGIFGKHSDDSYVNPQAKYHESTRYSEQLLHDENRISGSRYDKPTDDSHVNLREKPHDKTRHSELMIESRPSLSKYQKSIDDSFVKPQEKSHDRTRYSEQIIQNENRPLTRRYDKPTDDSHVKSHETYHDRTRYSELIQNESRLSTRRYSKPTDDSHVNPQEKPLDKTRHSELLIESRPSLRRYEKPIDDSFVKPQQKSHDRTRYSQQLIQNESRLSTRRYDKPTDDSHVKPHETYQDRTRYSEQLIQNEGRLSTRKYDKPTNDSHVKPQEEPHDKTRHSELMIESRPSLKRYDKPIDDSFVKPQEKLHDRTRYSQQLIQNESRLSVKPQDKNNNDRARYSEVLIDAYSRPSISLNAKPSGILNVKPQDQYNNRTRHSDLIFETESRSSKTRYAEPRDDSKVNPTEKNDAGTRYSEILLAPESRKRYSKSVDRHSLISHYRNNDFDTRQSKVYRQSSMAVDNTRDFQHPRQPILPQDNLNRSSILSVNIIRNARTNKNASDLDDLKNKEPTRKTLDRGTQSSNEYINKPSSDVPDKTQENYSPLISDNKPRLEHNAPRVADDKNEMLPPKYSYVPPRSRSRQDMEPKIQRQVAQYRDSVNSISPSENAKPIMDFNKEQKLPDKASNEAKTITQSVSRLSASSFAKPNEAIDRQPNLIADRTRTSMQQIDDQEIPPPKKDSMFLDRSYIAILSDLNVTQSNQYTSNKSPYKSKPDLPEDNFIRSRIPKESPNVHDIDTQYQQQPTGPTENVKDMSNSAELSPKPKTLSHATQSSNEYLNRSYSNDIHKIAPTTKTNTPLKSDTKNLKAAKEPEHNLSRLSNERIATQPRKLFDVQPESELHLQHDLSQIIEPFKTVSPTTSIRDKVTPSKSDDSEHIKQHQQQSLPATSSNDSKLIIQYESRPVLNRFEKPSLTSNRAKDSELIIQTESRHHSRNDSQIYISTPQHKRQPVSQEDSNIEQQNLPKVFMKKSDSPTKTFPEPATPKKIPNENPSAYYNHPENVNNSDDYIPFNDGNRLSLPVSHRKRDHRLLNKKYSTPAIGTNNNSANQIKDQVLQSDQGNNKPQLSKQTTVDRQISPIKHQLIPKRDSPTNTLDDQEDAVKDKPLEMPEVVDEKQLVYLYSRPNDNEENKENQQFKGNLQLNSTTSIISEFRDRPSVVVTEPEPKANIGSQEENDIIESPANAQPPTIKVDQSTPPKKDNSKFTTATMVLKPQKRKEPTTKAKPPTAPTAPVVPIPIKTKTFISPIISVTDMHDKSANANISQVTNDLTQANIQSQDSNLPQFHDSKAILRKPSLEPVNQGMVMVSPVKKDNKEPEFSFVSPRKIEEIPKTKQDVKSNIPEFDFSQLSRHFTMKQSTSSLVLSDHKSVNATTADKKETPENPKIDIISISPIKADAINLAPPKTQEHGTSTTSFIAQETKPAHTKMSDPSQESSTSHTADPESTTKLEPDAEAEPPNQGFVTSITIKSKTSEKPK